MTGTRSSRVWYVAYGSNLAIDRFRYYLSGGPVPGGSRVYPGARDAREPADAVGLRLPGGLVFAGRSTVWGGGIAFHDRAAPGRIAARGYLVTHAQFADVVAQETRQPPGGPVAHQIEERLRQMDGAARAWGTPGLYDTLTVLGHHGAVPLVSITHREVATLVPVAPAPAYVAWIRVGLRESHGWDEARIARYLDRMPGFAAGDVLH